MVNGGLLLVINLIFEVPFMNHRNITLNDVQLASAYYPLLINLAKHKHRLTYSELVEEAQKTYPKNKAVQNAIAVSTGRKLEIVRLFTDERSLPDLTCLIINKGEGECGIGFTQHFDPVAAREKVFAFDWSEVSTDFDGYIKHTVNKITPKKPIKRTEALQVMTAYHQTHKAQMAADIKLYREQIIAKLMQGYSAEEAFGVSQL